MYDDFTEAPRFPVKEQFTHHVLKVSHIANSANGQTTKFLLDTHDDKHIECVIMRHLSGRNTLCISCQAGCPMACTFCATGKLGLLRNLTVGEIVEQVMIAIQYLKGLQLRNIVFMGMGEPCSTMEKSKNRSKSSADRNSSISRSGVWLSRPVESYQASRETHGRPSSDQSRDLAPCTQWWSPKSYHAGRQHLSACTAYGCAGWVCRGD